MSDHTVVFIEPNPFHSRLQVLSALLEGVSARGFQALALIPKRAHGTDLQDYLSRCAGDRKTCLVHMRETEPRLGGWKRSIVTLSLVLRTRRLWASQADGKWIVLTAVDDYMPALWLVCLILRFCRPGSGRVLFIRYRVPELSIDDFQTRARGAYVAFCLRLVGGAEVLFDERAEESKARFVIPDPWSGPFGEVHRVDAKLSLGLRPDVLTIGLVGFQDTRKGFDVAVDALRHANRQRSLQVLLTGAVSNELNNHLHMLRTMLRQDLDHEPSYVPDEMLALRMAACDAVLLPYAKSFNSTSGVLVRCAASKVPVIASDHGLVGWRVRHWHLGEVFTYPDSQALGNLIAQFDMGKRRPGLRAYAASSTARKAGEAFAKILD